MLKFSTHFCRFLVFFILISASQVSLAKDLTNRLGLGYSDQLGGVLGLPSLTVKYFPNAKTGLSAAVGVDTVPGLTQFGLLLKLTRVTFSEENLNFYMGGGLGLVNGSDILLNGAAGFEVMALVGVEYFFPGLESLGFTLEAGLGIRLARDQVRFRTIGQSPLRAGMIFYF